VYGVGHIERLDPGNNTSFNLIDGGSAFDPVLAYQHVGSETYAGFTKLMTADCSVTVRDSIRIQPFQTGSVRDRRPTRTAQYFIASSPLRSLQSSSGSPGFNTSKSHRGPSRNQAGGLAPYDSRLAPFD
jgi:hypothetical protein